MPNDVSVWTQIGTWVHRAYRRMREPMAYLLVVIAVLGGLSSNPGIQISALGVLASLILRLLFEMHKQIEPSVPKRSFAGLADARDELLKIFKASLKHDGYIHIQWMGMTLFNVWGVLEPILDIVAKEMRAERLRFDVAMLDRYWLNSNRINPEWTGLSADLIAARLSSYEKRQNDRGFAWKFDVRRYAHMPMIHGGLINGKYLFIGISRWEDGILKAGDRLFDLYTFRDGDEALDRIRVFSDWFRFAFDEKPDWYHMHHAKPRLAVRHEGTSIVVE